MLTLYDAARCPYDSLADWVTRLAERPAVAAESELLAAVP